MRAIWPPLALLAAAFALRVLSFPAAVIDTDEGLYLLQAQSWLRGQWPLVEVWDMHPVGAPAVFAIALAALPGDPILAARLLGTVCAAVTGWALYAAVRVAGGPARLGLGAGLLYVAHTGLLGGLATNTELLFAPLVAAAMVIGLRAATGTAPTWRALLAMGVLIGCGFAIKPVVTPEGCLAFALFVLPAWRRGDLGLGRGAAMALAYAALALAPTAALAAAFAWRGDFTEFLDGSFLAPFRYAQDRPPASYVWVRITVSAATLLWPLLLALAASRRWGAARGIAGRLTRIGMLWLGAAGIAVVGPGFFYPHYFLMLLPPLSLLAALGAWWSARWLRPRGAAPVFALLLGVVSMAALRTEFIPRYIRGIGLHNPDPVRQVATAVAALVPAGETAWVANYHPVVHVLAHVPSSTRFVFPAHLTGGFARVADIDTDAEIDRILAERPAVIVVDRGWWLEMREGARVRIAAALAESYALATTVREERGLIEIWRRR